MFAEATAPVTPVTSVTPALPAPSIALQAIQKAIQASKEEVPDHISDRTRTAPQGTDAPSSPEDDPFYIPPEEIIAARTAALSLSERDCCLTCGVAFTEEDVAATVLYEGKRYHKECLPFLGTTDLKKNPSLNITLTLRASEMEKIAELLEPDSSLSHVHDKIANVLCEHNTWYVRCSFCGRVVEKHSAIVSGTHTPRIKEETGIVIGVASGRFFSKVRSTEAFCSSACDLNYSKHLFAVWQEGEKDKKAKASVAKERRTAAKGEKLVDALAEAFKMAKRSPDVAKALKDILAELAEQ
jgi:hypothetical protein